MLDGLVQKTSPSKNEFLFLTLLIICAIILRVWDLGAVGFNNDEAIYSGQAATLAGYDEFQKHFSIFRAHPLFLQFINSLMIAMFGISDTILRLVPAILGTCTIILTYIVGKILYDRKVAMVSSIVVTILSYHIILSRQVLLDVPLSFFYTLTLLFVILHFKKPNNAPLLYLIGFSAGLSFLSKEVGIFSLISSIVCLFLIKTVSFKTILIIISTFLLASSPFWIPVLTIPEANEAAIKYWNWQISRDPNQSEAFYVNLITQEALGYVLTGLCMLSIIYVLKTGNIKKPEVFLILIWITIPLTMFHFLAVKGFAFVLPMIPAFVLLGVSFLFSDWFKKIPAYRIIFVAIVPLIFIFSGPPLHYLLQIPPINLVGSGEEPHARESAIWIRDNIPGGGFLTLDIRTANIIKYYSNNDAFSLHANQNPAYTKVENPDLAILNGEIDYLVYDVYLAERFGYLKEEKSKINELVIKYNATPIHTEYNSYLDKYGKNLIKPAIIIYSLNTTKEN
jgi:4-amino-4-deoxy-L-arabinose transferase-like glycosyltransferase